ncbi:hypothetical protein F4819DRAFT_506885, partial [Hypoxylon fuscum]
PDSFREPNGECVSSPSLSPAPLQLPSNTTQESTTMVSPNPTTKLSTVYEFPLPPSRSACSYIQDIEPRSPVPPPYSSFTPKEASARKENCGFTDRSTHASRRTQSDVSVQSLAQWKPLPARPSLANSGQSRETMGGKQHILQFMGPDDSINTRKMQIVCSRGPMLRADQQYSPVSNITPPRGSSLPASMPLKGVDKVDERVKEKGHAQTRSHTVVESNNKNNALRHMGNGGGENQKNTSRFTPEELLWLHQNYRGEATFLKAWGLHVAKDVDREQGLSILRLLMAAEFPKEIEEPARRQEPTKRQNQQARMMSPARASRENGGLRVIEEERNTTIKYASV